ncbi:acetylornithine transaminase [Hazenella sp. IB182353]|uniref:aspartate aminotransferase family protein n=1 Tax=Polycladospora coralii TaxID=2771432 RepID=UPI001746DB8F|nr:acetylornithine transaminase [Polycladospora coralii]MBS7531974.1 acetylornithine transaminase [Polycladospora coralii]
MDNWATLDQTYIMSTVTRLPITIDRAEGNYLYDIDGNRYLDLFTGLAVNILGHTHPRLMETLEEQGNRFLHISNLFHNPPAIQLAKRLVEHTFTKGKVFFCNSGAEATEATIKLISKWTDLKQNGRHGIVVIQNSFHGRTLGALRLTRQPGVYQNFPQLSFPVFEVPLNDTEELANICREKKPAAILVEPIMGAGGVISLAPAYLKMINQICREEDMLFCVDEIQTGVGRTGTLFAYQDYDIHPDVILFAKGIGGGLPIGGIIGNERTADLFKPGDHGTTFAPSPLSAALGNTVLDLLLDDGLMKTGRETAHYLWHELEKLCKEFPHIFNYMDGKGMMIGIRTHLTANEVSHFQRQLLERGILVNVTAQTIIRLLPPLTLQHREVDFLIENVRELITTS